MPISIHGYDMVLLHKRLFKDGEIGLKTQETTASAQTKGLRTRIFKAVRGIPIISMLILLIFIVIGLFGNAFAPHNPTEAEFSMSMRPPFWEQGGNLSYPLGTDNLGRDLLSRLLVGSRISLEVGFVVVVFSGLMGCAIALLAGYLGGWVDTILMRITDTMLSLPPLMIAIVIASIVGPSKKTIIIILIIVGWAGYARILRGEVLRIRENKFIQLAVTAGSSNLRIMLVHIFPNILNSLVVLGTLQLGIVIIAESSLSFLGVGVPPPDPAWGTMVAEGRRYIGHAWWLITWPGLCILLVVLSCNLVGDWLRVRFDPKFRQI
jgi:peptide/nickel transport system permease protein